MHGLVLCRTGDDAEEEHAALSERLQQQALEVRVYLRPATHPCMQL